MRHLFHLRSKCTTHLAPNRVITKLLAIFPVLYFTSPWLFYTYQFVVFTTFTFFTQPPNLPPICQPSVCSLYLSLFQLCLFIYFVLYIPHISEIIWYLSFRLNSFSIMLSRSIHAVACGKISFLWPSNIPLCTYICTEAFIRLSTEGHLSCFHILAIVNNTAVKIGMHIFFWISVWGFFTCIPRSGIAGS